VPHRGEREPHTQQAAALHKGLVLVRHSPLEDGCRRAEARHTLLVVVRRKERQAGVPHKPAVAALHVLLAAGTRPAGGLQQAQPVDSHTEPGLQGRLLLLLGMPAVRWGLMPWQVEDRQRPGAGHRVGDRAAGTLLALVRRLRLHRASHPRHLPPAAWAASCRRCRLRTSTSQ
jgi:hypothetical protein